jgi:hypothetical protein
MSDLSQRGDLASLLSCPAPGRPPHIWRGRRRTRFDAYTPNFSERRQREVLRIHLPRTPLNRVERKGRGFDIRPHPNPKMSLQLGSGPPLPPRG